MTRPDPVGAELAECILCGCIGLPERVRPENHDCKALVDNE